MPPFYRPEETPAVADCPGSELTHGTQTWVMDTVLVSHTSPRLKSPLRQVLQPGTSTLMDRVVLNRHRGQEQG